MSHAIGEVKEGRQVGGRGQRRHLTPHPAHGAIGVSNGQAVTIDCTVSAFEVVKKLVLMAPGSITHHSDMAARYVELPCDQLEREVGSPNMTVMTAIPTDSRLPRGFYMLFALKDADVPSLAQWIKVR